MADQCSSENGINWADGHIKYRGLHAVVNESAAGFDQLYAYGVSKCQILGGLTGWPFHRLEDLNCPRPTLSITAVCVTCPAKLPEIRVRDENGAPPLRLVDALSA